MVAIFYLKKNDFISELLTRIGQYGQSNLTLFRRMEFPIMFDTIKSRWPIVYIDESQILISKINIVFLSLKIDFVLANGANPDEMPTYVAFHLALHYLSKYPLGLAFR